MLARLTAPAIARILDQIDRRLLSGGLETILPDRSKRRLGFSAKGPKAIVDISSWMALVRLATSGSVGWYKAWTLGEWSSPNPVKIFRALLCERDTATAMSAVPRGCSDG